MNMPEAQVTLVIDRWAEVAPGVMTFACTDLPTARRVARAMRNALSWYVVPGQVTLDGAVSAQARGEALCVSTRPPARVVEVTGNRLRRHTAVR